MADKKISELNDATLPLDGTEQIPIVQGGETKKVSADELGGNTKRVININLPFIRITQSSTNFYWQKTFGTYADFTLSTGKSDKNTLVGNLGKSLLQVPFDCKIISIEFQSNISSGNELVIGKVDSNLANYVNAYEKTFATGFFDDNPTMLFNFNKGEHLIPYFKINTQGVAYSKFNITLEEI